MKKLLRIVTLGAVALALPASGFAAEKKAKPSDAAPAPAPADGAKKPAEAPPAKGSGAKAMGMYVKVDAIDAKAKTFSHTLKDGGVVKHTVTDKTEIKNGDAAAKFEDIKIGDTVSGSRIKKSATEYEVVKITRFGVPAPKEKKPDAAKKQ